ncbi:MAG: DNA-binding protein, partial [Blautia wexlerae]|nr:DNA-binding protein [Blautia wexlerae]
KLNEELKQKGFITIAGKIPKKYLEERCYGLAEKEA